MEVYCDLLCTAGLLEYLLVVHKSEVKVEVSYVQELLEDWLEVAATVVVGYALV